MRKRATSPAAAGRFFRHAAQTGRGKVRETNEDAIGCDADAGVFALADGLGGSQAGEVASRIAVETIISQLKPGPGSPAGRIRDAVAKAHKRIQKEASKNFDRKGMGTTLVLAICRPRHVWVAHIGDSRAYLYSSGRLSRLTNDHTLAFHLVKAGEISESQARTHPLRNILDRSLGSQNQPQPEIGRFAWSKGDCLLLCSDGLNSMVQDSVLQRTIGKCSADPPVACRSLVRLANDSGGLDNISVIVVSHL